MAILDEIREAYAGVGIALDQPLTYGTYYRLRCARCGRTVGNVGDRLLPGMAAELVRGQSDLYASGLLGCACDTGAESREASGDGRADLLARKPSGTMYLYKGTSKATSEIFSTRISVGTSYAQYDLLG